MCITPLVHAPSRWNTRSPVVSPFEPTRCPRTWLWSSTSTRHCKAKSVSQDQDAQNLRQPHIGGTQCFRGSKMAWIELVFFCLSLKSIECRLRILICNKFTQLFNRSTIWCLTHLLINLGESKGCKTDRTESLFIIEMLQNSELHYVHLITVCPTFDCLSKMKRCDFDTEPNVWFRPHSKVIELRKPGHWVTLPHY